MINKKNKSINEDEFIGILIHIDNDYSIRDGEIVTLAQLASERNPYFIIRTAIEEGSDLPVTRTHSYGFSGGSLHLGNTKEYKGNFYFDENKIDKNSTAQYYNLKSKIYLKHHINFSLNSLPISNFSESNKVIQVVPKKINSIIKLEIISFSSENKILNTSVISNLQKDFSIERETSYIEIKSKYLDKNGVERSVSESKTTFYYNKTRFILEN